jgi:molecular chaperone GrpE
MKMKHQAAEEEKNSPKEHEEATVGQSASSGQVADANVNEASLWREKYLRAIADYQNLVRRSNQEKEAHVKYALEPAAKKIVAILDALLLAQKHVNDAGLGLVIKQFFQTLQDLHVEQIIALGKEFDPHTMECIGMSDGKEGIVVQEVSAGYMLYDRILSPAKVLVGNGKNSTTLT